MCLDFHVSKYCVLRLLKRPPLLGTTMFRTMHLIIFNAV